MPANWEILVIVIVGLLAGSLSFLRPFSATLVTLLLSLEVLPAEGYGLSGTNASGLPG